VRLDVEIGSSEVVRRDVPIFTLLNENDSQIQENLYKKSSNKVESKQMFNNVNGNVCFNF
jgi:hypothetical protein